jgi:hypothetical protein
LNMYTIALMLTVLVESVVALIWFYRTRTHDRLIFVAFTVAVNLFTHPLAWVVYTKYATSSMPDLLMMEAAIVAVESAALRLLPGMTWRDSILLAFSMNALSFIVGMALLIY